MAGVATAGGPSSARWKGLVADREFIGAEWFRFLRRKGIRRAIRIRKDTVLDELSADEWFRELQPGQFRMIAERTTVFGESMRVVATRSPAGDLVIIATDFHVWETWQLYKLRWTIESTFGSQKSRGFEFGADRSHGPHTVGATVRSGDPGLVGLPAGGRLAA